MQGQIFNPPSISSLRHWEAGYPGPDSAPAHYDTRDIKYINRCRFRIQTGMSYPTKYRIVTFFTIFAEPENLASAQTVRTSPLSAFLYNSLSDISIVCSL